MNKLQEYIGAVFISAAAALTPSQADAGGFALQTVPVQRTWVQNVPVYQRFDTYAATPCGSQYVGSNYAQVGCVPQIRQEIGTETRLIWDPCKRGLLDVIFSPLTPCPQPVCAPICAPPVFAPRVQPIMPMAPSCGCR